MDWEQLKRVLCAKMIDVMVFVEDAKDECGDI